MIDAGRIDQAWSAIRQAYDRQSDPFRVRLNRRDLGVVLQGRDRDVSCNPLLVAEWSKASAALDGVRGRAGPIEHAVHGSESHPKARRSWALAYEIAIIFVALALAFVAGHVWLR